MWPFLLVMGLLSLLLYLNTSSHGFVLDDISAITDNFVVQKGLDGLSTIWTTHYRYGYWGEGGSLYRPLTLSLFAWLWEVWPDTSLRTLSLSMKCRRLQLEWLDKITGQT